MSSIGQQIVSGLRSFRDWLKNRGDMRDESCTCGNRVSMAGVVVWCPRCKEAGREAEKERTKGGER